MPPSSAPPPAREAVSIGATRKLLGSLSIITLLMTIPQVLTIWLNREAAGVSMLSWGAYLISALVWFWYGLKRRDPNIYLPCIGWIVLDSAILVGAFVYG